MASKRSRTGAEDDLIGVLWSMMSYFSSLWHVQQVSFIGETSCQLVLAKHREHIEHVHFNSFKFHGSAF
jgi:hypothetical protein